MRALLPQLNWISYQDISYINKHRCTVEVGFIIIMIRVNTLPRYLIINSGQDVTAKKLYMKTIHECMVDITTFPID